MTPQDNSSATVPRRLLIIDGHAYAYRAFYAIRKLNSPTGEATNAIYGFIKMLLKMLANLKPTHVSVIWDGGLAEERMALLPGYKEQRAPMPDDLEKQLDHIVAYLNATQVNSCCREGVEADDWIATLTRQAVEAGMKVVIASADKDFLQLVAPEVGLLNPNDKVEKIWTAADVKAKTGVEPCQIVDWLSLIGDTVDNIPGVPGVGPKTAADLLNRFGDLDQLFARLGEVESVKLRDNLGRSREILQRNRQLIRLRSDMPCDFSESVLLLKDRLTDRLKALYAAWGFKTLLAELEKTESPKDLFSD